MGSADGAVTAVSAEGAVLWTASTPEDFVLIALDPQTGERSWETVLGLPGYSPVVAPDGTVIVADDGDVYVGCADYLCVVTGAGRLRERWPLQAEEGDEPGHTLVGPPLLLDGRVAAVRDPYAPFHGDTPLRPGSLEQLVVPLPLIGALSDWSTHSSQAKASS